jgi:hypothetical protein
VDGQFCAWLAEAYKVGEQRHIEKRHPLRGREGSLEFDRV